ncbi:HNH endonuclease family protein [Streptomyces sp. XM4011]|uniref:HNH endonuclease family protein n=1 Tax=Streptomyces sp. XM4011 TaxID=2929780 RepID=UPI001FF97B4B|nr:HNH endonuclease family protein [Streptomyces sp. XM4011]MCK1812780.1 HNH endonuclease family protein [Streptomyces sp. XM4011]
MLLRSVLPGVLACLALSAVPAQAAGADEEVVLPLSDAIASLSVAEEDRAGYERAAFRNWVDADGDGCDTRREVLLAEAVIAPTVSGRCVLSGGQWFSWYDDAVVEGAAGLDIDHLVPLAEAWDSGASTWDAEMRERYANDLGDPRSLLAVTAKANRSKGDKDPVHWMPPAAHAACRYVADWTAVKIRWQLSADPVEVAVLSATAAGCGDVTVRVKPAG